MKAPRRTSPLPGPFWRQWSASAVSNLGDGINFVAMPLLAFSLTQDERLLAFTTFATMVPWLVLALPIGVAVDRYDRRRLMIGANAVRLVLFTGIAVGAGTGSIGIWTLLATLAVIGACEVAFDSSAQAFVPMLVGVRDLPRANGYLMAAEVVAGSVLGLSVGAFLFESGRGVPFGINAASFAVAAVLIATIHVSGRHRSSVDETPRSFHASVQAGIKWLVGDRLLRTLAMMLAVANLGLMLGQGIFVKYAAVELGVTGTGFGLLLLASAVGAALGGITGHRISRRLGTRLGIIVPFAALGVTELVFWLAPAAWVIAIVGFVTGGAIAVWNVVTVSLRQELIPRDLFGRVNSVYRWLGTGASALGALIGGQLAFYANLRLPYLVAGVTTLAALAIVVWPVLRGVAGLRAPDQSAEDLTPAPPSIT